jgi:hypothetical protein
VFYDLWDMQSRSQLETFDTEAEALAAVRSYLAAVASYAETLSLGYEDDSGAGVIVAEGQALAQKARAAGSEAPDARPPASRATPQR